MQVAIQIATRGYLSHTFTWQDGSSSQFCRITALCGCLLPLAGCLLPLAAASFDCWLMLPSMTSFGHWLIDTFNTPLNTAAIHWLLSSTLTAAFIGCCSASFGLHTCWLAFCQVTFNATFTIPSRSSTFRVYQTRYENYIIISTSIFELTANLGAPPSFVILKKVPKQVLCLIWFWLFLGILLECRFI